MELPPRKLSSVEEYLSVFHVGSVIVIEREKTNESKQKLFEDVDIVHKALEKLVLKHPNTLLMLMD